MPCRGANVCNGWGDFLVAARFQVTTPWQNCDCDCDENSISLSLSRIGRDLHSDLGIIWVLYFVVIENVGASGPHTAPQAEGRSSRLESGISQLLSLCL